MFVDDHAIDMVRQALVVAMKIALPVLASGVLIGLIISLFQSVTQIQEQTLSMVPKIIAMTVVAGALLPWIIMKLMDFSIEMFRLF
jgi:flagellar biosynthetic protein FliQ